LFNLPDEYGHFDKYGGRFLPEKLVPLFIEVEQAYHRLRQDESFIKEYNKVLQEFSGRPTPLYFAKRFSEKAGGAKIFLKREDLNHSHSSKINSVVGQVLLAVEMNKKKIITETASGLGGVAVASMAAAYGLECIVFMGTRDIQQQPLNVLKMTRLGATLIPVDSGRAEIRDAFNEMFKYFIDNSDDLFWVSNSAYGPHPYPEIVRDFQSIIGYESYKQLIESEHKEPNYVIAPVAGGATALGAFNAFYDKENIHLIGVEAGGKGIVESGYPAVSDEGELAVFHGAYTMVNQDESGNIRYSETVSSEMRYPAVGPEIVWLKENGHVQMVSINDDDAMDAYKKLSSWEGIIASLEASHAAAYALKIAPTLEKEQIIIVIISGSGDKDIQYMLNDNDNSKRKGNK